MGSLATLRDSVSTNMRPASHRAGVGDVDAQAGEVAAIIQAAGQPVSIKRGHALFSAGDAADAVFVILSGVVRTSMMLSDGRRQILGFHEAGHLLGVTTAEQHPHSAEAVNSVRLQTVSRVWLQSLLNVQPHLCAGLIPLASRSIEAAWRHVVLLGRMNARERLCTFLLERLKGEAGVIELPMSRIDIADYLGLTIETVSRTMTLLRFEGVIQVAAAHEVEVADYKRLLDCLEESRQLVQTQASPARAAAPSRASMKRAVGG